MTVLLMIGQASALNGIAAIKTDWVYILADLIAKTRYANGQKHLNFWRHDDAIHTNS